MRLFYVASFLSLSLFAAPSPMRSDPPKSPLYSPYTPYDPSSCSLYTFASWVYWQPVTEDPMTWEIKLNNFEQYDAIPDTIQDQIHREAISYPFSSGFQVGLGFRIKENAYATPSRPWQIEAIFTQLIASKSSRNNAFGNADGMGYNLTEFLRNALPTFYDEKENGYLIGQNRAKLAYNKLDVHLAWPMWLASDVMFRLMTGASLGWIQNKWNSNWSNLDRDDSANLSWRWQGGGISTGADFSMPIGLGIGFFAAADMGLLFGEMKKTETYSTKADGLEGANKTFYRFPSFQPEIHVLTGIDYNRWFKDWIKLSLSAGWDFTWWFQLNQFGQVNSNANRWEIIDSTLLFENEPSGLGFQGLTLRGGIEF